MPIWDTEQGIHADGDGYKEKYISETDVAQLYTRDVISAVAAGCQRFFWFSADNTPEYGFTVFFGDYVPRPRLAALNACASFIEGTTFQKTFNPDSNTFAHLFQGPNTGVCVFWNRVVPMQLTLPMDPTTVQAFDTMGNAIPITGTNTSTIQVAAERPTFLQCSSANYNALEHGAVDSNGHARAYGQHRNDRNYRRCRSDADRRIAHCGGRDRRSTSGCERNAGRLAAGPAFSGAGAGTEPAVYVRAACQSGCRPGARPLWGQVYDNNIGALHGPLAQEIRHSTSAVGCIAFLRDVAELSQSMRSTCVGRPPPPRETAADRGPRKPSFCSIQPPAPRFA